jgi:hypothetical protein
LWRRGWREGQGDKKKQSDINSCSPHVDSPRGRTSGKPAQVSSPENSPEARSVY